MTMQALRDLLKSHATRPRDGNHRKIAKLINQLESILCHDVDLGRPEIALIESVLDSLYCERARDAAPESSLAICSGREFVERYLDRTLPADTTENRCD